MKRVINLKRKGIKRSVGWAGWFEMRGEKLVSRGYPLSAKRKSTT